MARDRTRRVPPTLVLLWLPLAMSACHETPPSEPPPGAPAAELAPANAPADTILFAYFTGDGEDGMKYALGDGRRFRPVHDGRPVMSSRLGAGLVRDPSIIRGPDSRWHAVWTTGWWAFGFGVAHSDDLVTWSDHDWVPLMEQVKGTVNSWAPEIHWDPERREYLVLWSSTVRGRFPETDGSSEPGPDKVPLNHRIWAATTPDFKSWSEPRVFFDPGFNVIDAVIVRDEPRNRWVLVCKDETLRPSPRKDLRVAFADRMQGEYTVAPEPITAAGTWVEGPSVLPHDTGWTIFFDRYRKGAFGAVETTDWRTFTPVQAVSFPAGARHGCVLRVTPEEAAAIDR